MTTRIHLEDIPTMAVLRALADERPDFVYKTPEGFSSCKYAHDDGPGCIIGHLIHHFYPEFDLAELDCRTSTGIGFLITHGVVTVESEALRKALLWAQNNQDTGSTWDYAVTEAEATYANYRSSWGTV